MVQPSGRWRMVGARHAAGFSTPGLFSSPVSIVTKGESQSPTTRLSLHEESPAIILCSERFHHALMCTQGGWTPDVPLSLLFEKTRDSPLGPRPWRTLQRRSHRHTS